jgi:hypothetical protein
MNYPQTECPNVLFFSTRAMEETDEKVSNVEDVEKIRLSRHKMER